MSTSILRNCASTAAVLLLLTIVAHAQTSQFRFDANGNLSARVADTVSPPQIIGQPQDQFVAAKESAAFSVVVADPRALTYQWRFNGGDLGGENGVSLLLDNVTVTNQGEYRVVLTNPSGSVTSAPAMLWIDSDADGMPDSWEFASFGSLANSATTDFDGDGSSNLDEYLNGTNPANTNSVRFRLTVLADNGSVLKSPDQGSYTNGESVTLTATAFPAGEHFHAWLGDIVTRSNPVTLVMTNNKSVFARFTPIAIVWTNPASGDWNTATNWTPNLVPGSNDTVVIANANTVTLNTEADCADFTLGDSTTGPTLTGDGTLRVRGTLLWRWGTMSGNGRTAVEPGATLHLVNPSSAGAGLVTRTLENGGTVIWSGGGSFSFNMGAVFTNRPGALFHVQNANSLTANLNVGRFDNAGIFRKSLNGGTTTVSSGLSFNNFGTVEVQTGTLTLSGGGTNSGILDVTPGASLAFSIGTFVLNSGSQLNGPGLCRINNGTVTVNSDTVADNLELIGGTLNGEGVLTIATAMNWTGGSMSGSGRTLIQPGATLSIASPSSVILTSRTLENGGTILWSGTGSIALNSSAVLTNQPGALFEIHNAASITSFNGGRLDNAGTLRKAVGGGTATVAGGVSFNNSGTVDVQTGTLGLAGGGTNSGSFDVTTGAELAFSGGTFVLNSGSQLNGPGLYRVGNGTLTVNSDIMVDHLELIGGTVTVNSDTMVDNLELIGGTLNGGGQLAISTAMNWTGGSMSGSGRTLIEPGATLTAAFPSGGTVTSRTLENSGVILWSGAGSIALNSSAVLTNQPGALFEIRNAASITSFGGGRLDNAGTLRKAVGGGTATVANGVSFNNSGTVDVQTGTLLCSGSFTNNGAVTLAPGTTNRLANGGTAAGTFTASAGALVEWTAGTFTLNPGAQLNGAGLYRITSGTVTANPDLTIQNFDLINGTLGGTGIVTISNAMNWAAGTMSGSGRTIIAPGATLNAAIPSVANLSGRTLENGGTVVFTGAGILGVISGAGITNRPGALFQIENESASGLGGSIANGRFHNSGTFRKSAGTGTSTIRSGLSFTNYGTVDIRSGILAANGGYTSTSNALLNCALGGTTPGTGYGQLQLAGTVTLNGSLSVDFINGFSPATSDTFTLLTAGTRNGSFADFFYPSNAVTMQLSNTANSVIVQVTDVVAPILQPLLLPPQIFGTNIWLTWTAVSNAMYRLEFNPDLAPSNWTALPGDVLGQSNTAGKLDPLTSSNRNYRVRVLQPGTAD